MDLEDRMSRRREISDSFVWHHLIRLWRLVVQAIYLEVYLEPQCQVTFLLGTFNGIGSSLWIN